MRKITAEEFNSLPIKGRGRSSDIFNGLINLKSGEGLLIDKSDWNRKATPSSLVRYIEKRYNIKFEYGALANDQGWAVKRLEDKKLAIKKSVEQVEIKNEVIAETVSEKAENPSLSMLRTEVTLFYLGRISVNKIEKIEDTLKAVFLHFWQEDKKVLEKLVYEILEALSRQKFIVMENEKTYLPLKK
ncbi:MAG: hypothetical protein AB7O73_04475 [Bacteroidia bacterium]